MYPHNLQAARPASAHAAGREARPWRLSPAGCFLAIGICLMAVGCASSQGMFPAWMSGDSGKGARSEPGGNPTPPPAAQASQAQSPHPEASKVGQVLQEYVRGLGDAKGAEKAGDLVGARAIYERLIAAQPGRYEAYHRLAVVADRQRRFEEAQSLYTQAIRLNPGNAELFNDLGFCYYLQGNLDKAESALLKAVAMSPAEARYRNNLGLVYGQQRHYDKALEQYRRAGGEGDAYYNLAFIKASQNDYEGAKDCFRRALAADPTHERARKALASFENAESQPRDPAKMSALADEETEWVPYVEKDASSAETAKAASAETPPGTGRAGAGQRSATQGLIEAAQARATMSNQTLPR